MKIAFVVSLILPCIRAQNDASAQNATAFALTYGYPLLAFHGYANQFLKANYTNAIVNLPELSTPEDKTVVKPNVDTLYSAALLDLSQSDLSLTVPDIPTSQYALFSFYGKYDEQNPNVKDTRTMANIFNDVFGDNYANVGTGNVNGSGKYLLRAPNGTFGYGVRNADSSSGDVAEIMSPTFYGILLVRWGVNASNIDTVHGYQSKISLGVANRSMVSNAPKLTTLGTYKISNDTTLSPAQKTLELLAKYAPWNQPETEAGAQEVNPMLVAAGISNGTYSMPSGVDIEAANKSVIAAATKAAESPANNLVLNNGWSITRPGGLSGNFDNGTNYAYRVAIASGGFLQLTYPNAVYPTWSNASSGAGASGLASGLLGYSLGSDEAIVYTFSAKPPLIATGFWSLTAYVNNYLIPNSLKRYEVGDRNNITYSDGSLVYGSNATKSDGSFQVLIQAADNPPPANWTGNWLPGPAGGGEFMAILRWYGAEDALLNGSYKYPVVSRQAAITGSGNGNGTMAGGGSTSSPSSSSPASSGMMPSATSSSPTSYTGAASVVWESNGSWALSALVAFITLMW